MKVKKAHLPQRVPTGVVRVPRATVRPSACPTGEGELHRVDRDTVRQFQRDNLCTSTVNGDLRTHAHTFSSRDTHTQQRSITQHATPHAALVTNGGFARDLTNSSFIYNDHNLFFSDTLSLRYAAHTPPHYTKHATPHARNVAHATQAHRTRQKRARARARQRSNLER